MPSRASIRPSGSAGRRSSASGREESLTHDSDLPRLSGPVSVAHEKKLAAEAAAQLVEDGMTVGLGTGSTVAYLLRALAARGLDLRCVATSPATEQAARALGLAVEPLDALGALDIAIDGADQVDPNGWLIKGGGGAHTREKVVAA